MSRYYDRQGNPITLQIWAQMLEGRDHQRVAETTLPDGSWVSTVWLGLDHSFGDGPPLLFETMVFPSRDSQDKPDQQDMDRYTTEAEAIAGHDAMVAKWRAKQEDA